jgi:aspartyl-tRNA(Asn)/glutamyl-tRNA(Gln) amidotransferase subunit C
MASQLTRDEVAHIARLAHLDLTDAELDRLAGQLARILAYAAILQEAESPEPRNADSAEPPSEGASWRPDTPVPSLDRADVLAQAPDAAREAGVFRVPKVL